MYLLCDLCKDCRSKQVLYNNDHYNRHMFDLYSISHISAGIIYSLILKKPEYVFAASIIFEVIENSSYMQNIFRQLGFKSIKDTLINIYGDTVAVMIGYYIYTKVQNKFNLIILLIVIETLMNIYLREFSMSYLLIITLNQMYKKKFNKDLINDKNKITI